MSHHVYESPTINIFYYKEQWTDLIQDCIIPLINTLRIKKFIDCYRIYFCMDRGESIRLVFSANIIFGKNCFVLIDSTIKHFLKTRPSSSPNTNHLVGVFENYPGNTVWYSPPLVEYLYAKNQSQRLMFRLTSFVSENIIKIFSKESATTENLISFSLYLLLIFVKVRCCNLIDAKANIKKLLKTSFNDDKKLVRQTEFSHEGLLLENGDIFADIFNEVWFANLSNEEFSWPYEAQKSFKLMDIKSTFRTSFLSLASTIFTHLDIRPHIISIHSMILILEYILELDSSQSNKGKSL